MSTPDPLAPELPLPIRRAVLVRARILAAEVAREHAPLIARRPEGEHAGLIERLMAHDGPVSGWMLPKIEVYVSELMREYRDLITASRHETRRRAVDLGLGCAISLGADQLAREAARLAAHRPRPASRPRSLAQTLRARRRR